MPLALLLVGIIFLTAAVRGKDQTDKLFDLIKDDFTGPNNFFFWLISIWVIGAVGYYKPLRPLSVAFMTLVVIVLFLANEGFFTKFIAQIGATQTIGKGLSTEKYIPRGSDALAIRNVIKNAPKNIVGSLGDISSILKRN